jgi:hypothetical protein
MRLGVTFLGAALLVACTGGSDDLATDDSSEINDSRGTLERQLDPPIVAPRTDLVGAKLADVLARIQGEATAQAPRRVSEDCKETDFKANKKLVGAHVICSGSETVRKLHEDGSVIEEHFDLNKDGKVDRYASTEGTVVTYGDANYDGKVDLVIERVDRLEDFSMKGYEETYPKESFLHRVREDRDKDGKLDHERLTAKGTLPPKS